MAATYSQVFNFLDKIMDNSILSTFFHGMKKHDIVTHFTISAFNDFYKFGYTCIPRYYTHNDQSVCFDDNLQLLTDKQVNEKYFCYLANYEKCYDTKFEKY